MKNDELEEVLGYHVRTARLSKDLTQAEVAERANVSIGAVRHLESGSGATVATLVKVLRALGEENWLRTLSPAPEQRAFNPLDLLAAAQGNQAARSRRVRRPRTATP
jgi:transcriptional regulator with XRE-family HTH domain